MFVYENDFTSLMDLIKLNVTILSVNIVDFRVAVAIISKRCWGWGRGYRQEENIFLVELRFFFCGSPASPESQVLEAYVHFMCLFKYVSLLLNFPLGPGDFVLVWPEKT